MMVVDFAPQLAMLSRASVMITNGGLGTIKECIWSCVPMIVLPCSFDQPGNAARVVYHRIGFHDSIQITPDRLGALIDQCLTDTDIKRRLMHLKHTIESAREHEALEQLFRDIRRSSP